MRRSQAQNLARNRDTARTPRTTAAPRSKAKPSGWTGAPTRRSREKRTSIRAQKGHSIDEEAEEAEEDVEEDDVAINNSKTVWSFEELVALENARATVKKDENYWQNIARRIPVEQNCAPKPPKSAVRECTKACRLKPDRFRLLVCFFKRNILARSRMKC